METVRRAKKNDVIANAALVDKTYQDMESVEAIKDASLKSAVKKYILAEGKERSSQWERIRLIGKMADHIKKDFNGDVEFAKYMGMTQSSVNKARRLAKVADECEKAGLSVSNAFELLVLKDESKISAAIASPSVANATQQELREAVKYAKEGTITPDAIGAEIDAIQEEKKRAAEAKKHNKQNRQKKEKQEPNKTDDSITFKYVLPYTIKIDGEDLLEDKEVKLTESQATKLGVIIAKALKGMENEEAAQ